MLLRITKVRGIVDGAPPASWDSFLPGSFANHCTLPVDWELDGRLITQIEIGAPLQALRVSRNGVPVFGIFTSTPVRVLYASTFNSLYRVEPAATMDVAQVIPTGG